MECPLKPNKRSRTICNIWESYLKIFASFPFLFQGILWPFGWCWRSRGFCFTVEWQAWHHVRSHVSQSLPQQAASNLWYVTGCERTPIKVISKLWHIEKKSSRRLTDQMDKHFISRWFYFKLLCDCFRYVLKRLEIISLKTKCRKHIFKLIQNTWKYRWNETNNFYLSLHNFSELRNLFSRVPMGNCFCCYFMQLFISLASRKCKRTVLYLKLFWYKFFVQ